MRTIMIGVLVCVGVCGGQARAWDVYHRGYVNPGTGTYVAPHYQTPPDNTRSNNYGTQGNMNPHTGEWGTRPAYPQGTWMTPPAPRGWR